MKILAELKETMKSIFSKINSVAIELRFSDPVTSCSGGPKEVPLHDTVLC